MRARNHVILSGVVSIGFQAAVHSWPATSVCFLSGVLIDVDHYLEYYLHRGKFPYRYQDLVDFCDYYPESKAYLIFHAYEYLALLWLLIYFCQLGAVWIGLALGLTAHMIADQFTNPVKPLFYFLTFRVKHHFEKTKILADRYFKGR